MARKTETEDVTSTETTSTKKGIVKGSPEWVAAKRKAKIALDERLGTARKINVRDDRR